MRPKPCKHCGKSVRQTVGNLGYCKKCIALAKQEQSEGMDLDTAKSIYANPKGHSTEELKECLDVLNAASQPVELNNVQFAALSDAIQRLEQDAIQRPEQSEGG